MADEEDTLYDEFGNYIGPAQPEEDEAETAPAPQPHEDAFGGEGDDDDAIREDEDYINGDEDGMIDDDEAAPAGQRAIVLHEDKKYYASAEDVYGAGVQTLVEDEDAQPLSEPIVAPRVVRTAAAPGAAEEADAAVHGAAYLADVCACAARVRNVALVGALHHGKTSLADALVAAAGVLGPGAVPQRYTDTRADEQALGVSVKAAAVTVALPAGTGAGAGAGTHHALACVDTPGHVCFAGEVAAALRLADGAAVVVDAVEGVTLQTERLLRAAVREGLAVVVVLNKVDRLVTELHIPPADAYHKLRDILESVNAIVQSTPIPASVRSTRSSSTSAGATGQTQTQGGAAATTKETRRPVPPISPVRGNVVFASALHGWCFTLESLAQVYLDRAAATASKTATSSSGGHHSTGKQRPSRLVLPFDRAGHPFAPEVAAARAGEARGQRATARDLARRLWGDVYYDAATRRFRTHPGNTQNGKRSFVEFVLEPLYKTYSAVLGGDARELGALCRELGVRLGRGATHASDAGTLLQTVLGTFLGRAHALAAALVAHVPSPVRGARRKATLTYTGALAGAHGRALCACRADGPLLLHATKLLARADDAARFDTLARVMSGAVHRGQRVAVLGEGYRPARGDTEDVALAVVARVFIPVGRRRVEVSAAPAGAIVLLEGVDESIVHTATICDSDDFARGQSMGGDDYYGSSNNHDGKDEIDHEEEEYDAPQPFRPLSFDTEPVCKIALEPLHPAELPKMLDGLRKVAKSYLLCVPKKEESGEHTLLGTGELHLDCVLRDLRELYAGIEIKVSDPFVAFAETVLETSAIPCFASTPNRRNKLTLIAEPLDPRLAADIERGAITLPEYDNIADVEEEDGGGDDDYNSLSSSSTATTTATTRRSRNATASQSRRQRERKLAALFLEKKYGWDELAAGSLWAFGPGEQGPNALVDDTLPGEADRGALARARRFVVQGFRWGVREGPLCEEPVRGVAFRVIGAALAAAEAQRSGVQLIPTARRACYSALLTAAPRLLEPVLRVEVQAPHACVAIVCALAGRRRGQVVDERPGAGTPLGTVRVLLPAIEAYGFETELRTHTRGQAFCQQLFDHWDLVPGDPCDRTVVLRPLEPAPVAHLAREFMVKTRRRKGLSDDVAPEKFFDEELRALYDRESLASGRPLPL